MPGLATRPPILLASLALAWLLLATPTTSLAQPGRLKLLGQLSFPTGRVYQETTVGGLSGIAYDPRRNVYYVISDDRGEQQAPRFYTLEIDVGPAGIAEPRFVDVTFLDSDAETPGIQPYARGTSDTEEIIITPESELIVSSERDQQLRPWLRRFALDGSLLGELPIPEQFMPEARIDEAGRRVPVRGVRPNLAFEGLALTPDGRTLYVANEQALAQDGPIATPEHGTLVRILRYDAGPGGWRPGAEAAYQVDKVPAVPDPPDGFADNGVSAITWVRHVWPDFDLLVMERSYVVGTGNDVWIHGVRLAGAQDTSSLAALPIPFRGRTAERVPLARMADLGIRPDNLEGMTVGPRLPNGNATLIVISDDNFSDSGVIQVNQFLLFELEGSAAPIAAPRPAAPAQVPAVLPRTGEPSPASPLLTAGLALIGLGLGLRRPR